MEVLFDSERRRWEYQCIHCVCGCGGLCVGGRVWCSVCVWSWDLWGTPGISALALNRCRFHMETSNRLLTIGPMCIRQETANRAKVEEALSSDQNSVQRPDILPPTLGGQCPRALSHPGWLHLIYLDLFALDGPLVWPLLDHFQALPFLRYDDLSVGWARHPGNLGPVS